MNTRRYTLHIILWCRNNVVLNSLECNYRTQTHDPSQLFTIRDRQIYVSFLTRTPPTHHNIMISRQHEPTTTAVYAHLCKLFTVIRLITSACIRTFRVRP